VLSLAEEVPTLLRPGAVSLEALREVLGEVRLAESAPAGEAARPSPGMLDRHYAPAAEVRLFPRETREAALRDAAQAASTRRVGVIAFAPAAAGSARMVLMPESAADYASRLYAALHTLDEAGCEQIWIEQVPSGAAWSGVRDRLRRAATPP
jgi:L-threonylcarbamoyladenylate synthase